jgi:hypothetical protein
MRFKELTESDIHFIKETYESNKCYEDKISEIEIRFDISRRTVARWIKNLGMKRSVIETESEQFLEAQKRKYDKNKTRFIITWAQNNTPVHKGFLRNIEAYAKFINADIHVIVGRYKNPTSVFTDSNYEYWDNEVVDYLDANRHDIHKYLSVLSDVKIQPTAVNPMSGMEGMSGINSCVFGSPKVHLETIPVLEGSRPKIMMTTGAVTRKNYTDSKAGKKGEFHHTLGFVIIEIEDNEKFYARQVTANDTTGNFIDLFFSVKNEKIERIEEIEAIVLGDIHFGDTDPRVMESTVELMNKLRPKHTIVHDLFNGHSISHHDAKNPIKLYKKEKDESNSLKTEINEMMEWVKKMKKYNLVIVRSNHDDFVDRWIINSDWKTNIKNSVEYMEYAKVLLNGEAPKGIIPYVINQRYPDIITLGRDESYKVKGWELGVHGDIGQSGTRGSLLQFRKLNTKMIVAHFHSPERKDGALSVGTSTKLRLDYNIGPSRWLHSHVIIHTDGKVQHVNFISGKFTTLK